MRIKQNVPGNIKKLQKKSVEANIFQGIFFNKDQNPTTYKKI